MNDLQALHQYATRQAAAAFRLLVDHYQRLVYSAARRRLAHSHDIEDVVQVTFLKLARSAASIRRDLAAWLYTTALNTANDLIRRDQTRRRHEALSSTSVNPTVNASAEIVEKQEWQKISILIDEALLELPLHQRSLIIEHFFQGHSQHDLAAQHNVTQPTISRRLDAAVIILRKRLARHGYTAAPGLLPAALQSLPNPSVPALLTTQLAKIGLAGTASATTKSALSFFALSLTTKVILAIAAVLLASIAATIAFQFKSPAPVPSVAPVLAVASDTAPFASTSPATQDFLAGIEFNHITVDFDRLAGADAIRAFSNQAPFSIDWSGAESRAPAFSIHLHDAPFLEGYFQLVKGLDAGIVDLSPGSSRVGAPRNIKKIGPWSVSGPFAVMLNVNPPNSPIRLDSDIVYRHLNLASFSVDLYVAPTNNFVIFPSSPTISPCLDDKHQPIVIDTVRGSDVPTFDPRLSCAYAQINIILPDSPGKQVPVLKGTAPFALVTNAKTFTTSDPAEHLNEAFGDATIEILPLALSAPGTHRYDAEIRFHRNKMPQTQWVALFESMRQSQVAILDGANNPLRINPGFIRSTRASPDSIDLSYTTVGDPNRQPHHIQVIVPNATRTILVPFAFKDVPLP